MPPTHPSRLPAPPTLSPLLHSVESLGALSRSQSLGEKHVFGRDPNLKLRKQRLPEESLTPKTEGHKGSSNKKAQFDKGKPCYRVGGIIQSQSSCLGAGNDSQRGGGGGVEKTTLKER